MDGPQKSARQVVATAVQDLVATRLGRGFVPLAVLFLVGIAEQFLGDGFHAPVISLGALGAAVTMLAYGLRISQRAFDRPHRAWMSWAMVGSVVPPLFALYVLAWRGLRVIAGGGGATAVAVGIAFAAMGAWAMRAWMKVVEVERLAQVMTIDLEG
ncbi:MAG: hypothetical protein PVF90_07630 [Gemmatimonadota bacterium]|jgi:hypothetical protein